MPTVAMLVNARTNVKTAIHTVAFAVIRATLSAGVSFCFLVVRSCILRFRYPTNRTHHVSRRGCIGELVLGPLPLFAKGYTSFFSERSRQSINQLVAEPSGEDG